MGELGFTHTETQRGRLWTTAGERCVGSKNRQTTPATTSTTAVRQLPGTANEQTAQSATSNTAPDHWAPRTRKRHQQEYWPQRPTQRSDPTQHAKGRTGDRPGPRKETATGRNVTRGGFTCQAGDPPLPDPPTNGEQ